MTNKYMQRRWDERIQDEPTVRVMNLTGITQTHGIYCIRPNQWTPVPKSLADRFVRHKDYAVEGVWSPISRFSRQLGLSQTGEKHAVIDPVSPKAVDIVIPVHNALDRLKDCLQSIRRHVQNYNIIIVNDASDDKTTKWINAQHFDKLIVHDQAMGFSRTCNDGIMRTASPWVCILNSDTLFSPHAMSVMMSVGAIGYGVVGPTTSDSAGIQCDHTIAPVRHKMTSRDVDEIGESRSRRFLSEYEETDVFGFCMLINQDVINCIGGFDWNRYGDGYVEDWDFVWRAQQVGFKTAWAKGAYVHHYGQSSFVDRLGWQKIRALSDKNHALFDERKKDGSDLYFDICEGLSSGTSSSS